MQATYQLIDWCFNFCHENQFVVNMSQNLVNVIIYSSFCLSINLCVLKCKLNKHLYLFMSLNHCLCLSINQFHIKILAADVNN